MSLHPEDVEKIARLAYLKIEPDEIPTYSRELSTIIDLVEQMNRVDISKIQPMAHPFDMQQPLRADQVTEQDQHEDFQSVAPAVDNGLYLVPRVIE